MVSSGDEERSEGTWTLLRPLGVAGAWGRWLLALDEFLECTCDCGPVGDVSPSLPRLGGMFLYRGFVRDVTVGEHWSDAKSNPTTSVSNPPIFS